MQREEAGALDRLVAALQARATIEECAGIIGTYHMQCYTKDGELIWEEDAKNMIVDVGVQYLLNTISAAPTVAGPFMFLMGGAGTVVGGDTMGTHAGWTEVGGTNVPAYSGVRPTAVFNAAAGRAKAMPTALSFTFTSGGTVVGGGLVLGTGAVSTKDSTAGVLYSAGTFAVAQPVIATNVLTVGYSTNLT